MVGLALLKKGNLIEYESRVLFELCFFTVA